jgi:hypothetical protein
MLGGTIPAPRQLSRRAPAIRGLPHLEDDSPGPSTGRPPPRRPFAQGSAGGSNGPYKPVAKCEPMDRFLDSPPFLISQRVETERTRAAAFMRRLTRLASHPIIRSSGSCRVFVFSRSTLQPDLSLFSLTFSLEPVRSFTGALLVFLTAALCLLGRRIKLSCGLTRFSEHSWSALRRQQSRTALRPVSGKILLLYAFDILVSDSGPDRTYKRRIAGKVG